MEEEEEEEDEEKKEEEEVPVEDGYSHISVR